MEDGAIPIALIDADEVVRWGLESAFMDDGRFEVVRSAVRPRDLAAREGHLVIVIDPAPSGKLEASCLREARDRAPQAKLVVFTYGVDAESLALALEAGVSGYLLKERSLPSKAIVDAVYLAACFPVLVVDEDVRAFFQADPRRLRLSPLPPSPSLTQTEREVLQSLVEVSTRRSRPAAASVSTPCAHKSTASNGSSARASARSSASWPSATASATPSFRDANHN